MTRSPKRGGSREPSRQMPPTLALPELEELAHAISANATALTHDARLLLDSRRTKRAFALVEVNSEKQRLRSQAAADRSDDDVKGGRDANPRLAEGLGASGWRP